MAQALQASDMFATHDHCSLRHKHLAMMDGMKPLNIINPMYSLYTQSNLVQFHLKFIGAACAALKPNKIRIMFADAPPEHGVFHKFILENTLQRWVPAYLLEAGDDAQIQEARRKMEEVCVAVL